MASGKNFAGWVPGEFVPAAEALVAERYKGNQSKFVADLVIREVQGPKLERNPDVLVELARHYHPTIADELAAALGRVRTNQPRAVVRVLDAVLEALNRDCDLAQPIGLFNSVDQMRAFLASQPSGPLFIQRMRQLVESFNDPDAPSVPIPPSPVGEVIREHHKGHKAESAAKPAGAASRAQTPAKRRD